MPDVIACKPLHFHAFGCDHDTACGKPVYKNCAEHCDDCAHKVNPVTEYLDDVTCADCIVAAMAQYGEAIVN